MCLVPYLTPNRLFPATLLIVPARQSLGDNALGKALVDTRDGRSRSGHIGLQYSKGKKIEFRNVKVRPIGPKPVGSSRRVEWGKARSDLRGRTARGLVAVNSAAKANYPDRSYSAIRPANARAISCHPSNPRAGLPPSRYLCSSFDLRLFSCGDHTGHSLDTDHGTGNYAYL